jgi:hypothetical protein
MRKHLWQSDGRLKTGRISLIFFICLVLGLGLLFNLQKPVDKAIIVVRHIFTAPLKTEPEVSTEKVEAPAETKRKVAEKPKKKEPKSDSKPHPAPVKMARAEAEKKTVSAVPEIVEKKSAALPEKTSASPLKKTVAEVENEKPGPVPAPAPVPEKKPAAAVIKEPVKNIEAARLAVTESTEKEQPGQPAVTAPQSSVPAAEMLAEEVVVAKPVIQPETSSAPAAVTLLTEVQRRLLSARSSVPENGKAPVPAVKFAAVPLFKVKKITLEKPAATKKSDFKAVSVTPAAKPAMVKNGKAPGITVAGKEYKKLHHAWQDAGRSRKGDDHVIPLQIENLRAAYDLLQMKAVVIRPDESCIDLADGSRIPTASLDRFSTTVLRVDDPWQKWGTQLKAAGLRPGQSFKVRYYLYDFVRRSIYARVNQAYRWSMAKGLIQAGTKPDQVDVLGRTFVIKRSGGGAFGVFVPLSLKTGDGRRVEIDPLCFGDAPDIKALHLAGLI